MLRQGRPLSCFSWRKLGIGLFTLQLLIPVAAAGPGYTEERQPCAVSEPLKQPFFGDLHVHTRYSLDASTQDTRTTPAQAYQFSQGERIGS